MCEEDRNKVLSLLLTSFFQDEPLAKCLQLGEPIDFAKNIINDAINDQCSFVVYHIQTKELVGVCINEIKYQDDQHIINEINEKISFILNFLNNMHTNINLFDQLKTNSLLHIFIINIDKNYRGYGLGSQLISASIEHAKKINIGGAYAEATNIYSLNSFKQQGFQVYDQLNYAQYDQIRLGNLIDKNNDQCQLVARTL
jgi:ribosomal protein S18 acetylase RimI-like enzyme